MQQVDFSWPATRLAAEFANSRLSSESYCRALCDRIQDYAYLNAFASFDSEHLIKKAREADLALRSGKSGGLLQGVPLIVKDNVNTTALPTSGGTPALKDNIPAAPAPLMSKLYESGALLAGKANLHELSCGGTSANHVFGPVRNPYDTDCVPGGSSGGTAAAVAAHLAPAGIGTDTMGSVRVPASLCGLYGFRPTVGRYPGSGIVPLSDSFDTAGPLARSMEDITLIDSCITGSDAPLPDRDLSSIRLGVAEDLMAKASENSVAVIRQTLAILEKQGVALTSIDMSSVKALQKGAGSDVIDVEFVRTMRAYLKDHAPNVSLEELAKVVASPAAKVFTVERIGKIFDPTVYLRSQTEGLAAYQTAWRALFADHEIDAIAFPTTPDVALPLDDDDFVLREGETTHSWFYFGNTALASHGRCPGLSLPVGLGMRGMPVGLELDGLPGQDAALLSTGRTISTFLEPLPAPIL
jgi:Asp-tRNA(Asn)/Glu-tRNA(Gln) amidotransferase A subunit family amidase